MPGHGADPHTPDSAVSRKSRWGEAPPPRTWSRSRRGRPGGHRRRPIEAVFSDAALALGHRIGREGCTPCTTRRGSRPPPTARWGCPTGGPWPPTPGVVAHDVHGAEAVERPGASVPRPGAVASVGTASTLGARRRQRGGASPAGRPRHRRRSNRTCPARQHVAQRRADAAAGTCHDCYRAARLSMSVSPRCCAGPLVRGGGANQVPLSEPATRRSPGWERRRRIGDA